MLEKFNKKNFFSRIRENSKNTKREIKEATAKLSKYSTTLGRAKSTPWAGQNKKRQAIYNNPNRHLNGRGTEKQGEKGRGEKGKGQHYNNLRDKGTH